MIIPIVIRGDQEDLPEKIKRIQYCDLSKFLLAGMNVTRKLEYNKSIDRIAKEIYKHYKSLKELHSKGLKEDCDSFILPSEKDARASWELRVTRPIGFPGRDFRNDIN
jgi:hypothetical protein